MTAATNYFEEQTLKWALTTSAATRPTAWYVGLFTSAPSDTTTTGGTAQGEVTTTGSGYSRQQVNFSVADAGSGVWTASSTTTLLFPPAGASATSNWGTVTHLAVFDAATGGNCLFHGPVTSSKLIETGDIFQITQGNLKITLD